MVRGESLSKTFRHQRTSAALKKATQVKTVQQPGTGSIASIFYKDGQIANRS